MRDPAQLRRGAWMPILIGLLCAMMTAIATAKLLQPFVLIAWYNDQAIPVSLWQVTTFISTEAGKFAHRISPLSWLRRPDEATWQVFAAVDATLDDSDLSRRYRLMLEAVGTATLVAFVVSSLTTWRFSPLVDRRKHISGRRLILRGSQVRRFFRRAERAAVRAAVAGVNLCHGMTMSVQRECRHILLMGATGSGKTVIIKYLLRQIFLRGDRTIVIDSKGDFTAGMPGSFILLAPHDQRSAIWDVASDVSSELDARELAASMIPPSKDPLWTSGAREILTGLVVALQKSEEPWSWNDLSMMIFSPIPKLRAMLDYYYPQASEYLELDSDRRPTKIAISFAVTLRAHLAGIIIPLAHAWTPSNDRRSFSIRAFLADGQTADRTLILQRASNYPDLSTAWMRAFVTLAANHAVSPALGEDDSRRIWFCADEFPQLGKLDKFQQILEVGRSRGIRVILGIQDPHQLKEIYGADAASTWQSSIGTKIICRMEASASADLIRNEIIGKRVVSWSNKSVSWSPWRWDSSSGTTHSRQSQNAEVDVVSSAWLETELGWHNAWPAPTIRALIVGVGRGSAQAVLRAEWIIEAWPALRPATVPAAWTR